MIVALNNSRFVVTCKKNKGGTQKVPKYTSYTEIKKLKKSNINPLKQFLTGIFGEEIDYDKFNKESKYAIRLDDDINKSKKW